MKLSDDTGSIGKPGACDECTKGQLGLLDRPWGQGHHLCNPMSQKALDAIRAGHRTTEYIDGRWIIVNG